MSTLATVRRLAWDTETTGPNPLEDRIVTAAIVARGGDRPDRVFSWLINPQVPIPAEAAAIHGITDAKAKADGQDPKTALDEIATHLARAIEWGMPIVAFNQSFDWSILHHDLARHGLPTVEERVGLHTLPLVDPHVIDKQLDPYVKGSGMRKLKPTAERYGVELTDWHTAEADALAALLIAEAQFERYPRLDLYGPAGLHTLQVAWARQQAASLAAYFRFANKPDRAATVRGDWPLIPHQTTTTEG